MFCKKGIYVNWGNIPQLEFDFGPINLFSGGNGSGKTTAADGLQSLMTAAHENLFTYNPGQDETTQKGRGGKQVRTLASYVLGCDDGSYARTRLTDGYVAGIFHPTHGEHGEMFTAVMCIRARLDAASSPRQARQDSLLFLIVPGQELKLSDFVVEDKGGKYVVPITEISARLTKKYGKGAIETYDKKGPYLRRLYGALRGLKNGVPDREAKHAARTFSNFMAYKPVKSITEFVANEILEPKDLSEDIRQVSELMKTIHSMDEETRHLHDAINNLETAQQLASTYINTWVDHCVNDYCEATRLVSVKQKEYVKQKNELRLNHDAIAAQQDTIEKNNRQKQHLHDQLIELQAQRQGIGALKDKDQLEKDIDSGKDSLVKLVPSLLHQDQQFGLNHGAAEQLSEKLAQSSFAVDVPALDKKAFRKHLKDLVSAPRDTGLNTQELLTKDWVGICSLEDKLTQVSKLETLHNELVHALQSYDESLGQVSIRDQVFTAVNKRKEQLERAKLQLKAKQQEIQQLSNQRVNYPHNVEAAIAAIQTQCPHAKPAVLCDFVEVSDPEWQMAIEGYIGGARFSIIVEPEYEAEAIRIVRSMKGGRNNARVIQGHKVQRDASRMSLPKNSIVDVIKCDHKIVEYFLKASYGNVIRVDDEDELRKTARGITARGLGSGNYSMFRCDIDDAQLVFGIGARERALTAQQQQRDQLEDQCHRLEEEWRSALRVHELIGQLKAVSSSELINTMVELYRRIQKSENQLDNLDLSDHEALEEKLEEIRSKFQVTEKQGQSLSQELGGLITKSQQLERVIEKLANEHEQLQAAQEEKENAVNAIPKRVPSFNAEKALEEADDRAEKAGSDISFETDQHANISTMDRAERDLYDAIMHHNQINSAYNAIVYHTATGERNDAEFLKHVVQVSDQVNNIYHSLKNNVLVGKHEQLSSLKESFNTAFVTNLCHSIYQSINHGKNILEELNKELEHHRFGADRERFYFDYEWVPEFKEYWAFFKEIIDAPNIGDGQTLFDADLSEKGQEVRDRLMSMLLDKDEQAAQRELKRLSDYRNYRFYEIYKEPLNKEPIALSKYGTGSGGQLETPAYIIRSAAVTSAFKFNEGSSHCRMVLVDEAFSKMDETRSREVINYLTETLGLQLIFIMPTSKSGPFMDLISHQVVFSKCPTTQKVGELNTRVLVDRKVCNQDKIKQLWANHRKTIRQQAMLDFMEEI